jgi:hypothetical protein
VPSIIKVKRCIDSHRLALLTKGLSYHSSSGEGLLQLIDVANLTERNQGIGNRRADVRSHNEVDALSGRDDGRHERHDDTRGGAATLNEHGGDDTDHQAGNGVGIITEQGGTVVVVVVVVVVTK